MTGKLVLIDGHSILNRAFFGIPELTNAKGFHTNAIYGFLNIMFRILEEEKPEYLVVAFDVSAPTFRHLIYKEYKGTRKKDTDIDWKNSEQSMVFCQFHGTVNHWVRGSSPRRGAK